MPHLELHWIPKEARHSPHERAHDNAKRATEENSPNGAAADYVKSSYIRLASEEMEARRTPTFRGDSTARWLERVDTALPGGHVQAIYNSLKRSEAAILVQLRTGLSRLKSYLERIARAPTSRCPCEQSKETVVHYLSQCSLWKEQRTAYKAKIDNSRWQDISYALGGYSQQVDNQGRRLDGSLQGWKPDLGAVRATIGSAKATQRLDALQPAKAAQGTPSSFT